MRQNGRGRGRSTEQGSYDGRKTHSGTYSELENLRAEFYALQEYTTGLYQHAEELTEQNAALEESAKKSASDLTALQAEYKRVSTEKDEWQQKAIDSETERWERQNSAEYIAQLEQTNLELYQSREEWQQDHARLQQENSELWTANKALDEENTLLQQASQHQSVTVPQQQNFITFGSFEPQVLSLASRPSSSPYATAQRFQEQKAESSISGMISTTRVRPDTFEDRVFKLSSRLSGKNSTAAVYLEPLRTHLEDGEDRSVYFQQFIPYILEEIYANIAAQMKTISNKPLSPFVANCTKLPTQQEILKDWQYISINVKCKTSELPKLDHGFYNEAIFIELEGKKNTRKHGREENFNGLLVIASINKQHDEDSEDQEDKKETQLALKIPRQDYLQCRNIWERNPKLKIHWLCGLIPASRAYQVCIEMPHTSFDSQFIRGKLEPWPSVTADLLVQQAESSINPMAQGIHEDDARLQHLNSPQKNSIKSLLQATSGMYCLQGPPGTGKTTMVKSLVLELTHTCPTERILLCTPSNEALRILLAGIRAMHPDLPIALIGISNNLSDEMGDVFVHNYARRLYKPLIELKKEFAEVRNPSALPALVAKIRIAHRTILEKLEILLLLPGQMPVDSTILEQIQELFTKMRSQTLLWESEQYDKMLGTLKEQLKETILSLKENKHVFESFFVQRAHVVFSTLISSGRDWLKKQVATFPTVIIDEAAQALVPDALIPLRFNPKLYIHVGDPNQLPATIKSKVAQEGGYGNSLMYWLMCNLQQPFEMLNIQYRMHPQICQWPSDQFYAGELETAPAVLERECILNANRRLAPVFKQPCLFFNIHGAEDRRGSDNSASISNEQEAIAVVKVLHYLLQRGFEAHQIGIITFYSAQVERIMQHLHKMIGRNETSRQIKVSTVDGFQGGEKDITLLSMVRTSKSVGFLNDQRRVNVAMTRARYGRFVFGSSDTLSESNSDIPNFLRRNPSSIKEEHELTGVIGLLTCTPNRR